MEINWREKLTSRKFWVAIADFVTGLLLAFGVAQDTATQVAGLIMAGAGALAYIIAEGLVDAARAKTDVVVLPQDMAVTDEPAE